MDIVGWAIGGIGIIVGIIGLLDSRRQRATVGRISQHQSETIHNLRGFLLAVKGRNTVNVAQVNDRLQFIKEHEDGFNQISTGKQ
jgi:hypothetical protein